MGNQGGFPPTDSGEGGQQTPEGGWGGTQPTQPTPTGGWGAPGEQPTPDSGWGAGGGEQPTPAGGWGAGGDQPTPDSGWGAQPTQPTPASPFGAPGISAPPAGGGGMTGGEQPGVPKKKGGIGGLLTGKPLILIVGIVIGAGILFALVNYNIVNIGGAVDPKAPSFAVGPEQLKQERDRFRDQLNEYTDAVGSIEEAKAKASELGERQQADGTIETIRQQVRDMEEKQQKYDELEAYLDDINDAITTANSDLVRTNSELEIVSARSEGLKGDVRKLEVLVGNLEDANNRRVAVKEALESSLSLLLVRIKESSPLTPPEYKKDKRVSRAQSLQHKLAGTNWAYPELISDFTDLFLEEIKLNSQHHYFMAKLPLELRGEFSEEWCECLSLGTWAVYFQTLDRRNVGVFLNMGKDGKQRYEFVTTLNREEAAQVRGEIARLRPDNFSEQVVELPDAPKQKVKSEHGKAGFFDLL